MPPVKACALPNTPKVGLHDLHNPAVPTSAEKANIVKADQLTIRLSENQTALLGHFPSRVMEGAADRALEAYGWGTTFSGFYGGAKFLFCSVLKIYGCSLCRDLESVSFSFRRCADTRSAGTAVGRSLVRSLAIHVCCSSLLKRKEPWIPAESSDIP
jgi:hypothetical protein